MIAAAIAKTCQRWATTSCHMDSSFCRKGGVLPIREFKRLSPWGYGLISQCFAFQRFHQFTVNPLQKVSSRKFDSSCFGLTAHFQEVRQ